LNFKIELLSAKVNAASENHAGKSIGGYVKIYLKG
jgi:hypothetical protein